LNIVVCIKRVPNIGEVQITVASDNRNINSDKLVFEINEADNYALEAALQLKEKFGGTVTAITVGNEASNEQLRMCMAKGADAAIRLDDEKFKDFDGYATARVLCAAIKELKPDLILTGCMSSDNAYAQVGVQLGEMLNLPHATLVTDINIGDSIVQVRSELENGLGMIIEMVMPAVISVQTGINEPRYASFRGIREAVKREIKVMNLADLAQLDSSLSSITSRVKIDKIFIPPVEKKAQYISGSSDEKANELARILKEKGLI